MSVSSKVLFHQFCSLLEKISKLAGDDKKKKLLIKFIQEWKNFHDELVKKSTGTSSGSGQNDTFFDAMRLLLPHLDRDREAYGIKEHKLAHLFIDVFALNKNSSAGNNLINFKTAKTSKDIGDFASIAQLVLKDRCPEKGTLTISQVNEHLDSIAMGHITKDQKLVQTSLLHLIKNVSSCELKWLVRMILKDLKLGMGQKSIFKCFHADAEELYNVKMSLKKVCSILHSSDVKLHEIEISTFSPFKPMLANREDPFNIENLMKGRPFFIETKYDGERMQLHLSNGSFKYFSRGGNEYTHIYGESGNQGNLTQFIANQLDRSVNECILDGEMVGYDPVNNLIGTKGENIDIKSAHLTTYQPMYIAFDVLLYNGRVLTNQSLKSRRSILNDIITPLDGRIMVSEAGEKYTNTDCMEALNKAIENGEEGIMIKDCESIYKPNCRQKGGWFKIKPDYVDGLMNDLDLVIIGGFFGTKSDLVTHFLLGCISCHGNGKKDDDEEEGKVEIHTFCKVGCGFTNKELLELNGKLSREWVTFDKNNTPYWLKLPSTFKQKPDVVIKDPKKSVVLQVKAADLIKSEQYQTKYTLRFPRVEKVRYDKNYSQCFTLVMLNELLKKSKSKLVTGSVVARDDVISSEAGPSGVKKRCTKRKNDSKNDESLLSAARKKPSLHPNYSTANLMNVAKGSSSSLLAGKEICVMVRNDGEKKGNGGGGDDNDDGDSGKYNKNQLERLIISHGGDVVQNPDKGSTNFIIADHLTLKLRNVIKLGYIDVVKSDWLVRSMRSQRLETWLPSDFLYCSQKTKTSLNIDYDCFEDSYHDNTTIETLKNIFEKIPLKDSDKLTKEQIAEIDLKYPPATSIFRKLRAVHYRPSSLTPLSLESILFSYHGGVIVDDVISDGRVTHVFVSDKECKHKIRDLFDINNKMAQRFHIVKDIWVLKCLEEGKILEERFYTPSLT